MKLEEGLKEVAKIRKVCECKAISVVESHINQEGWSKPHVHTNSYEMYHVESGAALVVLRKKNDVQKIQINSTTDFCIIEAGVEHMVFFKADSDVKIYRFTTEENASVIHDIYPAAKLEKLMDKCY